VLLKIVFHKEVSPHLVYGFLAVIKNVSIVKKFGGRAEITGGETRKVEVACNYEWCVWGEFIEKFGKVVYAFCCSAIMAFPVVEFSRQGYKIRKVFGKKSTLFK
jgi:hypothetical protein